MKEKLEIKKAVESGSLYDELMGYQEKASFWDPHPDCTHVHIVVGDSFAGSMRQALKSLGWANTHKLIHLFDNYSIGPLHNLDFPEGRTARRDWFRENITATFEDCIDLEEEYNDLLHKLKQIPGKAEVIIWTSRSVREQVGLRHALYLLDGKPNVISVHDACASCEDLFNRPEAFIEYRHSGEITSNKLQEVLSRINSKSRIAATDMARLKQEWLDIAAQVGTLRIWKDGSVLEVPADYFDKYLLSKLDFLKPPQGDNGFLRSARLIGEAIGSCEQDIDDSFFEYRLRELIYNGNLEIEGIPAGMRFYSVRRKKPPVTI